MAKKTTTSVLRTAIQGIYREMMTSEADGVVSNEAVIERVRETQAEMLRLLAPDLERIALTKLLNDVGSRRGAGSSDLYGVDLFGEYHVKSAIPFGRGNKKSVLRCSVRDLDAYLAKRSKKVKATPDEQMKTLLGTLRKYMKSNEDTLEMLLERQNEASDNPSI